MEGIHIVPTILIQARDATTMLSGDVGTGSVLSGALRNATTLGLATLLLLMLASVTSWGIILYKWWMLRLAQRQSIRFLDTFWSSKRLDAIFKSTESLQRSPVAQVFRAGYIELAKLKKRRSEGGGDDRGDTALGDRDNVQRALKRAALTEITLMESLVSFLGTVGTTAPFLGLFGTVVGIMQAFNKIGQLGNANLATVAPGISEALFSTIAGLVAAIPAVVAFNYLNDRIRLLDTEMDNFTSDFLNIVERNFF